MGSKLSKIKQSLSGIAKSKAFKRSAIAIIGVAVIAGAGYGAFELRAKSYFQGCIDGGSMGLIQILPFAAGEIIKDRANIFGGICGDLRDQTSQGKSLDDLLKAAQEKQGKPAPQKQEDP